MGESIVKLKDDKCCPEINAESDSEPEEQTVHWGDLVSVMDIQSSPNDQYQRCSGMATIVSLLFVMNTILAIALVTSSLFVVHKIQSVATNFKEEQLLIVDHQDVQKVTVDSLEQQINAKMSGMKEQVDQLKDKVRLLNQNKA